MSERVFKSLLILFLVGGVLSAYYGETQRVDVRQDTETVSRWLRTKIAAKESRATKELIEFASKKTTSRAARKKSMLRHFGEFRQLDGQTGTRWALSRNSKNVSHAFRRRWEAALNKVSTPEEGVGFSSFRNGPRTYFLISYLERFDDDAKIIYSGILDWDWLVPTLSEVVDGRSQISVTDRNGIIVFSDSISTIGSQIRNRVRPAQSRLNYDISVTTSENRTQNAESLIIFTLTLMSALGLLTIFFVRRNEEASSPQSGRIEIYSEPLATSSNSTIKGSLSEETEKVQPTTYESPAPRPFASADMRALYDSLVVALVAIRAENSKHEKKNIRVIEEQLRKMKSELGVKVELESLDFADSDDTVDVQEEIEMMTLNTKRSPIPRLPEAPPEALELDWDSDFVVRRPKVNEIEH